MKKLLLSLGSIASIAIPTFATLACSNEASSNDNKMTTQGQSSNLPTQTNVNITFPDLNWNFSVPDKTIYNMDDNPHAHELRKQFPIAKLEGIKFTSINNNTKVDNGKLWFNAIVNADTKISTKEMGLNMDLFSASMAFSVVEQWKTIATLNNLPMKANVNITILNNDPDSKQHSIQASWLGGDRFNYKVVADDYKVFNYSDQIWLKI